MSVMSDRWIRQMAQQHGMIEPFVEAQKRQGVISYGLSSYGYDARVADEFKILSHCLKENVTERSPLPHLSRRSRNQ
jgi:dCTP deaminase